MQRKQILAIRRKMEDHNNVAPAPYPPMVTMVDVAEKNTNGEKRSVGILIHPPRYAR